MILVLPINIQSLHLLEDGQSHIAYVLLQILKLILWHYLDLNYTPFDLALLQKLPTLFVIGMKHINRLISDLDILAPVAIDHIKLQRLPSTNSRLRLLIPQLHNALISLNIPIICIHLSPTITLRPF